MILASVHAAHVCFSSDSMPPWGKVESWNCRVKKGDFTTKPNIDSKCSFCKNHNEFDKTTVTNRDSTELVNPNMQLKFYN